MKCRTRRQWVRIIFGVPSIGWEQRMSIPTRTALVLLIVNALLLTETFR
jgi:hypothetical protein